MWKIPAHDPRLAMMSVYEFELELETYTTFQKLIANHAKEAAGPSKELVAMSQKLQVDLSAIDIPADSVERPPNLYGQALDDFVDVTPEELGWDRRGS